MIKLRPIDEKDEIFLWDMLFEITYSLDSDGKPSKQVFLKRQDIYKYVKGFGLEKSDTGFVAETEEGRLIGAAWYRLYKDDNKGFGYIGDNTPELSIAVSQGYRNKGIGKELLEALIEAAEKKGFASLSLNVDSRNTSAVRLFEAQGFKVLSNKETSQIMKLILS
ncbi:MAG: GNAT family N-acetyltransferase [Clostridiaceae bacterium]